ncbi:hypothetical protein Ahy_A01g003314 isoform D [Arachis hypogaea]|nr:hypothetical protein Ahy_A01g003314 isoform D [Arachis hypogaea]
MTVCYTWFHERFRVLPADATDDIVRIYARAYIMMLLSSQLFADKNANRVHLRWLPYVASLEDLGRYSWGSAALAWLYRCLLSWNKQKRCQLGWATAASQVQP